MPEKRISLKEAIEFHGHLGPWLVLGILAGEFALRKLGCKKYFDLQVKASGVNQRPRSCLIDGLQLSTGATYGKGNIKKLKSPQVGIEIKGRHSNKRVIFGLKKSLSEKLEKAKTHRESEILAKRLYNFKPESIFDITTDN